MGKQYLQFSSTTKRRIISEAGAEAILHDVIEAWFDRDDLPEDIRELLGQAALLIAQLRSPRSRARKSGSWPEIRTHLNKHLAAGATLVQAKKWTAAALKVTERTIQNRIDDSDDELLLTSHPSEIT